jgi:RNA polymerase sigma-70 factor (ECF subfamily)
MNDTPSTLLDRLQGEATPADWQRLVDLYDPLLRHWLQRDPALRAEVDDLIQDILQSVVRKIPDFRRQRTGSFRSWLRVITANRVHLFWRRQRSQLAAVGGDEAALQIAQLADPESPLSQEWDAEHNRYVLARLMALVEPTSRRRPGRRFGGMSSTGLRPPRSPRNSARPRTPCCWRVAESSSACARRRADSPTEPLPSSARRQNDGAQCACARYSQSHAGFFSLFFRQVARSRRILPLVPC